METYYKPEHLPQFPSIAEGNPKLAELFFAWYGEVFKPGALSAREKALIALAVAQVVQCPYCIDAYSKESLQQGADLEQMTRAEVAQALSIPEGTVASRLRHARSAFESSVRRLRAGSRSSR